MARPRRGRLLAIEDQIARGEGTVTRYRWDSGRIMLGDHRLVTPAGHFRHGVIDSLAASLGVSERELRRRLQCARTYPTAGEIGHICGRYRTWRDLCEAGFPPAAGAGGDAGQPALVTPDGADVDPDAVPGGVVDQDGTPVQLELVLDVPGLDRAVRVPAQLTLRHYRAQIVEWRERHDRHGESLARHVRVAGLLRAAVDGDEEVTVADAAERLRALPGGTRPPLPPAA